MNLTNRVKSWLQKFLGVDAMLCQISELRQENERLTELFKEHDKAIAYIAIVHGKAFKEIMLQVKTALEPQKRQSFIQKKPDDDLIN